MSEWPRVLPNDDGIRPNGGPDKCFYCQSPVGTEHARDCVCVRKRIKVRYSFEIELDMPYAWDAHQWEFNRNDGTWCANNAIDELENYTEESGGCLCDALTATFICVTDETPFRNTKDE